MLTLKELMARLSYGPLANLAISGEGSGGIIPSKQRAIIHYTNDVLTRLHGKFLLKENELILRLREGESSYTLSSDHAFTKAAPEHVLYIMDTKVKPYEDDLLKILTVFNSAGCEFPLNDEHSCNSLFTPQYNVLQIPCPTPGALIFVSYQANHKKISADVVDLETVIDIPEVLIEAMVAYIGSKVIGSMNGQEHVARSIGLMSEYSDICKTVAEQDLVNSTTSYSNTKFSQRGFK